jgi:hypothetical protein
MFKKYDNDHLYDQLDEFINKEVDPVTGRNWKDWYLKVFYKLGKDEVLKIASIAKADGKDKKRYFSKLLKEKYKELQNA